MVNITQKVRKVHGKYLAAIIKLNNERPNIPITSSDVLRELGRKPGKSVQVLSTMETIGLVENANDGKSFHKNWKVTPLGKTIFELMF